VGGRRGSGVRRGARISPRALYEFVRRRGRGHWRALAVVGLGQPAQAAIFALGGALRGAGDTRYPLIVSLVNWFLIRLPLAYVLAFPMGMGLTGIWFGVTVDYFVRALLLALRFRSGAWARVRV